MNEFKCLLAHSFNRIYMRKDLKSEKIRQNLDAVAAAKIFTYVTAMTYFSISNTHLNSAGMMLPPIEFAFKRFAEILLTGQYANTLLMRRFLIPNGDSNNYITSISHYNRKFRLFIQGKTEVTTAVERYCYV